MVKSKVIYIGFFLVFAFPYISTGQFNENVWCFGDSAGIDFNTSPPTPVKSNVKTRGACTSICDANGNLLFYASNFNFNFWGVGGSLKLGQVFNQDHELIKHGDSINARSWYSEMMLLNDPGDSSRFLLFHMGVTGSLFPGFYYSVIEADADSGRGEVIQKNIQLDTIKNCDGMHAVKHANGRDWWIVSKKWHVSNNDYYTYLISPTGIQLYNVQSVGSSSEAGFNNFKFSPDGNKFISVTNLGLIELFDFDRCTGLLSNPETIDIDRMIGTPAPNYWGCEFSPDGSKIYLSTVGSSTLGTIEPFSSLFQLDLNAPDILASKVVLDTISDPYTGGQLKLGPDNKIYFTGRFDDPNFADWFYVDSVNLPKVKHVGVIHQPNNLGLACDFRPYDFYLGGERTYYAFPNNPNYRPGAIPGTVCDSLGLGINEFGDAQYTVQVFPNPVNDHASIIINAPDNLNINDLQYELLNSVGQRILTKDIGSQKTILFNRDGLSSGIYFYRLSSKKYGVVTGKILVQ